MNKPTRNRHPLFKIANSALVDLPTPSTIRGWWNFGSLLGICLVAQIVTGLFLAIHYCPDVAIAFDRVRHICRDVNYGWLLRTLHEHLLEHHYSSYGFVYQWRIIRHICDNHLTIANNFNKYSLSVVDNIIDENNMNNENLTSETTDPLKYLQNVFTQSCTNTKLKNTTINLYPANVENMVSS